MSRGSNPWSLTKKNTMKAQVKQFTVSTLISLIEQGVLMCHRDHLISEDFPLRRKIEIGLPVVFHIHELDDGMLIPLTEQTDKQLEELRRICRQGFDNIVARRKFMNRIIQVFVLDNAEQHEVEEVIQLIK